MSNETTNPCKSCGTPKRFTFTSEIAIRFAGVEGLTEPIVFAFPEMTICLDCGLAEFVIPERELEVLRTETPVEGVAMWLREK